jgi:hypothetical protein
MIEWLKNDLLWAGVGLAACIVVGIPYYFARERWRHRQWEKKRQSK